MGAERIAYNEVIPTACRDMPGYAQYRSSDLLGGAALNIPLCLAYPVKVLFIPLFFR